MTVVVTALLMIAVPGLFFGEHKLTDRLLPVADEPDDYSMQVDSSANLVHLSGTLDIGVVEKFGNLLEKEPLITGVVLNSLGGNIYQARGLANLIQGRDLDTYVFQHCYSACAHVFVAGSRRFSSANAKLGFHSYRVESPLVEPLLDIEREQQKDQLFFSDRIPDLAFVEKIFLHKNAEIWVPTIKELIESGVVHTIVDAPN